MAPKEYELTTDSGEKFQMIPVEVLSSEEAWTKLHLEDGTTLRIKIVVTRVGRSVDKPIPGRGGEPLYHVVSGNIIIADVPRDLYLKEG